MALCPSCNAPLEEGADLCLECGEPLGDSPAAKLARKEAAASAPPPAEQRVRAAAPPNRPTMAATGRAMRKKAEEDEPVRCPGCGVPSRAARCPGCGGVLRREP